MTNIECVGNKYKNVFCRKGGWLGYDEAKYVLCHFSPHRIDKNCSSLSTLFFRLRQNLAADIFATGFSTKFFFWCNYFSFSGTTHDPLGEQYPSRRF
jgi:hypothetical protein